MEGDSLQHIVRLERGIRGRDCVRCVIFELALARLGRRRGSLTGLSINCIVPQIALFDRPKHRFFEFLQRDVLRIAYGL